MRAWLTPVMTTAALLLSACAIHPTSPKGWAAPEALMAPSSLTGVHGLAVDRQGRLLAGSVVDNAIWTVDRQTGAASGLPGGPGLPPPYVVTGVAVGADGAMYFSADRNNGLYRIRPQR